MRTKHNGKQIRTSRRRHLALALMATMAAPMAMAQNLPQSGTLVPGSGSATIGQTGNTMTITQSTKGAIIDWYSFDIGTNYGVTFDQQLGASSVTLNRVTGFSQMPSMINGALNANGNVFIINPAGIVFGSGSQANVGGLVASSLDIDNADFLSGVNSGQYRFTASGSLAGAIRNDGRLTAVDGGTIALIGSQINNAGTVRTSNGNVVFGATRQVTLDQFGDGLTQVTVSGNGLGVSNCQINCKGGITSSGNVYSSGGTIEIHSNTMSGASAGNALFVDPADGGRVWISGKVFATTSGSRRGSILIDAGMGNIDVGGVQGQAGNIGASSAGDGEQAGTVELRGNQLFVHLCIWTNNACENNNALGFINASTYGAGGLAGGTVDIDVTRFYHAGVIQAASATGPGGTVNINAVNADIYNLVTAESIGGVGGTINITADNLLLHRGQTPWLGGPGTLYSLATLSAYGATSGGTVNLTSGNLSMVDLGNVSPDDVNLEAAYRPTINVNGFDGNGGSINVDTSNFDLSPWQYFEAIGTQAGGNIAITADSIKLAGGLVATGATGGSVNLRPRNTAESIVVGAGNGFSLTSAELAKVDSPLLVIGSAQHAGAIRVLEAVSRDGDLTLQNQGGNGGIDIQAAMDVGDHTLALASGGNIIQTAIGGITAHSLLAIAGGNVALTAAENNLAASSLAGSAGGDFAYEDVDDLAIGDVSSFGYSAIGQSGLLSVSATGITAQGDVLVRTASGDLTLGADVSGNNIDLVAAETFHNPGGTVLNAGNDWRIWARTWEGEERGGLQGEGPFDIYDCAFGNNCTGVDGGNRFIYQEPRLLQVPIAPTMEEASGALDLMMAAVCPVADSASDQLQVGTSSDELAREWLKSRHRLRISNCIDSKSAPGCRF